MKVNIHIERLILDGLEMTGPERRQLDIALRDELARLLASGGLESGAGAALSSVEGPEIRIGPRTGAQQWGQQIASAVHASLAGPRSAGYPAPAGASAPIPPVFDRSDSTRVR